MLSPRAPLSRPGLVLSTCLLIGVVGGCGDDVGKRHPVEGQVRLQGKPLKGVTGAVTFVPDQAKGNKSPFTASGPLDAEGRYRLSIKGKPGVLAGWYKVLVTAVPPGTEDRGVVRKPVLHSRFTAEKSTPLSEEVVADRPAGSYDLEVTRN